MAADFGTVLVSQLNLGISKVERRASGGCLYELQRRAMVENPRVK